MSGEPRHAIVLVLGDVGRSPRMQYHALSLARSKAFTRVFLVGYHGERCVPDAEQNDAISQVLTADLLPRPTARALYLAYAPTKAVLQLFQLLWTLISLPKPEVVLLQTPPQSQPLAAAWLVRFLRGGAVIIDWHNLGFSMLEHTLARATHPFVRLSRAYESRLSRRLDGHLCVTAAMAAWLQAEWGLEARVLHDRPPSSSAGCRPPSRTTCFAGWRHNSSMQAGLRSGREKTRRRARGVGRHTVDDGIRGA